MISLKARGLFFLGIGITIFGLAITLSSNQKNTYLNLVHAQTAPTPTPNPLDWPQLGHDPQRTNHSAETITSSVSQSWAISFASSIAPTPERLYPQVQPVVSGGKIFIGTEMGSFYAINATTGARMWIYPAISPTVLPRLGPIVGTAGVENGKVFFGSLDGNVYALNISDGSLAWKFNAGPGTSFSSSVLLTEGKVFIPSRKGIYYALNQSDGTLAWQKNIGAPIFMSSAYNNGKIYFGAMDMRVYAISSTDGSIVWQSNPVPGFAFKDYWPVVSGGYVFIRPYRVEGGVVAAVSTDTSTWSMFALSENSTTPAPLVFMPHSIGITMNGATCPPPVDKDGYLIVPSGGSWTKLNVVTKQIVMTSASLGNPDENMCASTVGVYAVLMHTMEGNAQTTGLWNLNTNSVSGLGAYQASDLCGGTSGMGCYFNNSQSGGTNPAAISNGYIYHTTQNTLNARKAN